MAEWEIEVGPYHPGVGRDADPDWPQQAVRFRRDGVHVASVYATESTPGIQVASNVLDLTSPVYMVHAPVGGGMMVCKARVELEHPPIAIVHAPFGPWVAFPFKTWADDSAD